MDVVKKRTGKRVANALPDPEAVPLEAQRLEGQAVVERITTFTSVFVPVASTAFSTDQHLTGSTTFHTDVDLSRPSTFG